MNHWGLIAKVEGGLVILWGVIFGIKSIVAPHKATPERVNTLISEAQFDDYSQFEKVPNRSIRENRLASMEEVASVVNRLDLTGQEESRDQLEDFWNKMSAIERRQFVDLTMESFTRFFEALDALTQQARRQFVERGFRELEDGTTEERFEAMLARDPEIMEHIAQNGMKAYFENASAETKMELAPFLKATNEMMQGIRGQPFQGGDM